MSEDLVTGLASMGLAIGDATKKPDVPKPPSETALAKSTEAKKRAALSQGMSSTIIAGRNRSALGIPGNPANTTA